MAAEIFQLCVTCRQGQANSMPLDYYVPGGGGGGGGSLNMSFFVFFRLLFLFFIENTSPEGYIIYRIVNCVSVI